MTRRRTDPSPATVALVRDRDGDACIVCGLSVAGGVRGLTWSIGHRRPRQMGGSRRPDTNSPENLYVVCGSGTTGCHGSLESHRADAIEHGWLLRQDQVPANEPILVDHRRRWVRLTPDGSYAENWEATDG